jgi:4-aminobutyrate aminotransferase-like enzyme
MARLSDRDADDFVEGCRRRGVLLLSRDRRRVRLVTHLDVTAAQIDTAADVLTTESER